MTTKTRILIVEDEIIIANDLQHILSAENYDICGIASSYEEAIELFYSHHPQIIICDIYLRGEKTGIDFANKINMLNNIPIIFITAFSSNELITKVTDMNHISYITKPFTNSQVIAAVNLARYRMKNYNIIPQMTPRQEQILLLIKDGIVSNKAIASRLNISSQTVKSHKKGLFQIFQATTTAELIKAVALL
jgi:two-component system, response regulator PdtaR